MKFFSSLLFAVLALLFCGSGTAYFFPSTFEEWSETLTSAWGASFHHPVQRKPDVVRRCKAGKAAQIATEGFRLDIPAGALSHRTDISVMSLRFHELPALDAGMVNVTLQQGGFRCLPHGTLFRTPVVLRMAYDSCLIPSGYTAQDIRTFFFNDKMRCWQALPKDSVVVATAAVVSHTTHFTDFINAIIKLPDAPETQGYKPTSIKDLKAAPASEGITLIAPPTASNTGTAALQFPLKLPAPRQGMGPQLGLRYNSEGGNGPLGIGWDMSLPSIGIETGWGVPRYDPNLQTETYTMGGEMLTPVAHRDVFVARQSGDVRFYPRVEGSFSRIIRHGTGPKDYWWEVTNTDGSVSFYGGDGSKVDDNAVLRDDLNGGNIAQWMLQQTRDVNGNFVRYRYRIGKHPGVAGGSEGWQIYPESITYTGHGQEEGKYRVRFLYDSQVGGQPGRLDVSISGRLGFKQVTAEVLKRVVVELEGKMIREYEMVYETGAFFKTLLAVVLESDAEGKEFYRHSFDYWDEVRKNGQYRPFSEKEEEWEVPDDSLKGGLLNPLPKYNGRPSALGGSKSWNWGANGAVEFGIGVTNDKNLTLGLHFGYSKSESDGLVANLDLDGDGLADKVFKQGGVLWYERNLARSGLAFAPKKEVLNVKEFSHSSTSTFNGGIEATFYLALGLSKAKSKTVTDVYFTDFNGDGRIDVALYGDVWFNKGVNSDGQVQFTPFSSETECPVVPGAALDTTVMAFDPNEQAELIEENPLHDVVRLWKPPYKGTVTISAPINLQPGADPNFTQYHPKDGVRATVEHHRKGQTGSLIQPIVIEPTDFSIHPVQVVSLQVDTNDHIYFRLHARFNGAYDKVVWKPEITYTTIDPSHGPVVSGERDANGHFIHHYQADEDFVLGMGQVLRMPYQGTVKFAGRFQKPVTSDSVTVQVLRTHVKDTLILWQQGIDWKDTADVSFDIEHEVFKDDQAFFRVKSATQIDWTALRFNPRLSYLMATDSNGNDIPVLDDQNQPLITVYPAPQYTMTNYLKRKPERWVAPDTGWLRVTPVIQKFLPFPLNWEKEKLTYDLTLSIKGENRLYARRTYLVFADSLPVGVGVDNSLSAEIPKGEKIFVEYHIADRRKSDSLELQLRLSAQTSFTNISGDLGIQSGLATILSEKEIIFGTMHRGWGQFAYRANGTPGQQPIVRDSLKLPDEMRNPPREEDMKNVQDPDSLKSGYSPAKAAFVMMMPDAGRNIWIGYDEGTWVGPDTVSTSRMGDDDVRLINVPPPGSSELQAPTQVSVSRSTTWSSSVGIGGLSVAANHSDNSSTTRVMVVDVTGDNVPDIVGPDYTQPSTPLGGRSADLIHHQLGSQQTGSSSTGVVVSGTYPISKIANCAIPGLGSVSHRTKGPAIAGKHALNAQLAGGSAQATFALVGDPNTSVDHTEHSWQDINGDGLADKVYRNGLVQLNYGYHFGLPEKWEFEEIRQGKSIDRGGTGWGGGFNWGNSSFSGGISLSQTESFTEKSLQDVNGDGLVDVVVADNPMQVRLNLGNGFSPVIPWKGATKTDHNMSTGEAVNGGFTVCIFIPLIFVVIKICGTPSINAGQGVSSETHQLSDIDGDGHPDLLRSGHDGELFVTPSTIGKTNLLRSVRNPLRGSFSLNYTLTGNTYDHPQSKWVLSEVTTDDGIADDGPNGKTTFTYQGGRYDRRERRFYGFKTVTTTQWDTPKNNPYRRTIQEYDNSNYYTQGTLLRETGQDGTGHLFTQTTHTYQLRDAITKQPFTNPATHLTGTAWNALLRTEKHHHEGKPTAGLTATTTFEYDDFANVIYHTDALSNAPEDLLTAQIEYHTLPALYLHNIPKSIIVNDVNGETRRRDCDIDNTGNVTRIRQYLNAQATADYNMEYDVYGNLTQITRPPNYRQQRMSFTYTFDPVVHTYPIEVIDSFGYTSKTAYDYAFGLPLETTDMNGQRIRYTLDARGRVSTITGPYELAANLPYTIAFDYYPDAPIPYARTRHYDPETGNDIETYTFIDGFQRPIQVKKTGAIYSGDGAPDLPRMIVSGRVKFDALGRTIETRHPLTEALSNEGNFNTNFHPIAPTRTEYDVLDRPIKTILPDATTTHTAYTIGTDNTGYTAFQTTATDALSNVRETFTDLRGRKRADRDIGPDGDIWTHFRYNAIGELLQVIDVDSNLTLYTYDHLGRTLSFTHPDQGTTFWTYDLAGNKLTTSTPNIRASIADSALIRYTYDFTRLKEIFYPNNFQNNVTYHYGKPGDLHGRVGRIWLVQDASGGEEYFYGPLGEQVKIIRTLLINPANQPTFVWENTYDTWHRIQTMTYPDGENVDYAYNAAGKLRSISSTKDGHTYPLVTQIGYDEFEQRQFLRLGNNTVTTYTYQPERRRLSTLVANTASGRPMMRNTYTYDAVDNVTNIINAAPHNGLSLGGKTNYTYTYDALYRLTDALGTWEGHNRKETYTLAMRYDNQHNILRKTQTHLRNGQPQYATTHDNTYAYTSPNPHAPTSVGKRTYTYDADGNTTGWTSNDHFSWRRMLWDEEKRLMAVNDNGLMTLMTYNAAGERAIKSSSGSQSVSLNGALVGAVLHDDTYTAYVSPYLVAREGTFTKHYFIESERVVSKIGQGHFENKLQFRQGLTAGNLDYQKRMAQLQDAARRRDNSFNRPPGVPTQQGLSSQPQQTGVPYPALSVPLSQYTVPPPAWGLVPKLNASTEPPGTPVKQQPGITNEQVKAGYGFHPDEKKSEDDRYYFHPDHLGSTSYITNAQGEVRQHLEYLPFGEAFAQESTTEGGQNYRFTGKELDSETGLYYFGARYYDPHTSIWQSVDPLTEKYPGWSGYNYVMLNPVGVVDPDGQVPYALRGQTAINKQVYKNEPNSIVRTSKYREERKVGTSPHIGVDYRAPIGTPFYSLGDGTVKEIGETKSGAKYIKVEYEGGDVLRFLHISEVAEGVGKGSKVSEGQELGKTGNTGKYKSNGKMVNYVPHLHVDGVDKQGNSIDPEAKNYGRLGSSGSLGEKPSKGTESGPLGKRLYRPEGSRTGRLSEE